MKYALESLESLRLRIVQSGSIDTAPESREHIAVSENKDSIDISFYGSPLGESYLELIGCVGDPNISSWIRAISLTAPDEGANGTKNWNLEPLLARSSSFDRLEILLVQLNQAGDHNRSIVGAMYEEDGVIGEILERAPHLRRLQVPSAPDAAFFGKPANHLQFLSVDAGYSTQEFIENLAASSNLRTLRCLEWGEYQETYMEGWESLCTPTDGYRRLFADAALPNLARFVWRNPVCSAEDIRAIKASRDDLQILVVRTSAHYV